MKKSVFLLLCLALLPAFSARAGKVVTDSLQSVVLGAPVKYNVYLPDGFGKTEKKYPVVYLLHGLSDDYTAWVRRGNMQLVANELIGTGEACEMVIIMPNAGGEDTRNTWLPCTKLSRREICVVWSALRRRDSSGLQSTRMSETNS